MVRRPPSIDKAHVIDARIIAPRSAVMRTCVRMTVYSFTLTEYDAAKPWLIVSTGRDSVELGEGESFHDWARGPNCRRSGSSWRSQRRRITGGAPSSAG